MMKSGWTWAFLVCLAPATLWADPNQPVGWWTFNEDAGTVAADRVQGRDGVVFGGAGRTKGIWSNAIALDGVDDYVQLPIGTLLSTMTNATVAAWVNFAQNGGSWERIWDFGSSTNVNWFLTPCIGTSGAMRAAITVGGSTQESQVTAPSILATGWHHVAVTIEQASMKMRLILDGKLAAEGPTLLLPRDLGVTSQNWLGRSQYSADSYFKGAIDDVRLYAATLSLQDITAVMADSSGGVQILKPEPEDGRQDVPLNVLLRWPADPAAVSYILYFGTSKPDVETASLRDPRNVLVSSWITENQYQVEPLSIGRTYYWRVDRLVGGTAGIVKGSVWSFTTALWMTIDDFELYTDDMDAGKAIFQTWIDGWGDPYNGAYVGHSTAPFAEQSIVYSGSQSMPLSYDNVDGFAGLDVSWQDLWNWLIQQGYTEPNAIVSEATRTFNPPMDWTRDSLRYLVLRVRGTVGNMGGHFYVKVNDTAVQYPDSAILTSPTWRQWAIDLNDVHADLKTVRTLTIGVSGPDRGVLYVDEIALYQTPPAFASPEDPGTKDLAAWYGMDSNVSDQSGAGLNAQTSGSPTYVAGVIRQAIALDGIDDYVILPIGNVIARCQNLSVATWVNFSNQGGAWQRIFDFGSGTSINMFLTPRTGTSGPMRFAIRTASVGEQQLTAPATLPSGWHHVTVVIRGAGGTMALYLDGQKIADGTTALAPMDLGVTTQNWLGRSQYPADAYFQGALDDFRIYTTTLTEPEIQYLAGVGAVSSVGQGP